MPFDNDSSITIDDFNSTPDLEVMEETPIVTENFSKIPTENKEGRVVKAGGISRKTPVLTEKVSEIPTEKKQDGRFKKGGGDKKTTQTTSGWSDKMKLMDSF